MGSLLGFRPPQFSEDAAWLPIWLQQHNVEPFDEGINTGETPFERRVKELHFFGQDISKEENANVSPSVEGGYKSCHLSLSGDESSPLSFAPSIDNVVHFHLRLSSDSNSESMPSPLGDASQLQRLASNCTQMKQLLGTSIVSDGKIKHSNVEYNAFLVSSSPNSRPHNGNQMMRHEENVGYIQVDDISDVVELSIAASEALVIRELMTGVSSKPLSASTVLEAAIQVKQARLDIWKETSHYSTADIAEIDFLSDLDDLTMQDAYESVGLSIVNPGDLPSHDDNVSQVKDTLTSENEIGFGQFRYGSEEQIVDEYLHNEMIVDDVLASEISCGNRHKKVPSNSVVCLDSISKDCCNNPAVHCLPQENLQVSASLEVVDCGGGEGQWFQVPVKSSLARNSEVSEKYTNVMNAVPRRFQSRWFGGWTWKEDEKSFAQMEHQDVQGISKPFVGETSFLSESADVAPDQNSVVQEQVGRTILSSQSSIPSEVYSNKGDKETIHSQDVMRCSSLSFSDPLCSIVPCSFSSETIYSTAILNHEGDILTRNCSMPKLEYTSDKLQRASNMVELVHAEESTVPVTYSEEWLPAARRQFTSLRPYSVMFANPGTTIVKENYGDRTSPLKSMVKSSMVENLFSNLTGKKNFDEAVEDGAVTTILRRKEKKSTLILDLSKAKSAMQDNTNELFHIKEPKRQQSNCENQSSISVPARKYVRFLEAETKNPQDKKLPKQPRNCSKNKATKRLRNTNRRSESGAQELKRSLTNCFNKNEKRLIFQNMEFLLTGFSNLKEKQYGCLIRKYGGMALSDIPSPNSRGNRRSNFSAHKLPVILSLKKLQTIKFLYGCAVNAFVLKVDWLTDSIVAGSILPPERYTILSKRVGGCCTRTRKPFSYSFHQSIFDNVGIMLHGKNNFCTEMTKIIKHGGGRVFRTLQSLVDNVNTKRIYIGAIVAENESRASRHLKHCALEWEIPMMSTYWIVKSLHVGKLLPCNEKKNSSVLYPMKLPDPLAFTELSEEI